MLGIFEGWVVPGKLNGKNIKNRKERRKTLKKRESFLLELDDRRRLFQGVAEQSDHPSVG